MQESNRLTEDRERSANWKRWGPYLPDRQWATVREDYSASGDAWNYFSHEMAQSRTYRWGEDGLLGWCDRQCRLCFSVALWNHKDPFLKERLFGLTGPEGNHGEDVKEVYHFLDSTPTHSYARALYKYPQREFPYQELREENARRGLKDREYEIYHTQAFADEAYFDCILEYAKAGPDDTLIRCSITNRGEQDAPLTLLPTCWFRNTWSWGRDGEGYTERPEIRRHQDGGLVLDHPQLGVFRFWVENANRGGSGRPAGGLGEASSPPLIFRGWLFTENDTNRERLFQSPNPQPYVKDAFHRQVVEGEEGACNPAELGTKAAAWLSFTVPAGETVELRFRLCAEASVPAQPFGREFDHTLASRLREADEFYAAHAPAKVEGEELRVWRQALAGLFWSKKFYYYAVDEWLDGDPTQPPPPASRKRGRNRRWRSNLYNRDVLLLPDSWEYPWYASWDTAFHVIPLVRIDPDLAKQQLLLLLREWYMHPNGQIPAYEWDFGDVNPPVHAWACWRVYQEDGNRDRSFLERVFQKLLINFTWWINRVDVDGNNVFSGGFLGLDNIGPFDRSRLPKGATELEQADGTAWLAFYCCQMLQMALELAKDEPGYEDIASKFFEHFVSITHSMNGLGDIGLWDEDDGFYYDLMHCGDDFIHLKVRSMVGLLSLVAVDYLNEDSLAKVPNFCRRLEWFLANRPHLSKHIERRGKCILLAVATRDRLRRVLERMLNPEEFLSDFGVRSMSRYHAENPFHVNIRGQHFCVAYEPAESESPLFGGNSNWRGPIWFPVNYLLIEALEQYHEFYGNSLKVPNINGGKAPMTTHQVAQELRRRLVRLFLPGKDGVRPSHQDCGLASKTAWQRNLWFHEYFDGDTGRGLGSCHQQGWTALVAPLIEQIAQDR